MFPLIKKSSFHEEFVEGLTYGDLQLVESGVRGILYAELTMLRLLIDTPRPCDPNAVKTRVDVTFGLSMGKADLKRYKKEVSKEQMVAELQLFGEFATKGPEFQEATGARALYYLHAVVDFLKSEIAFFAEHMGIVPHISLTHAMGSDMPKIMTYLSTCMLRTYRKNSGMPIGLDTVPMDIILARMSKTFGVCIEKFEEHVPDDEQLATYDLVVSLHDA